MILTVVGYSVNDTVVVYDRIRENQGKYKGRTLSDIVNLSINEVLGRTFLTSFATALSLIGLLVLGVGTIFDFSAAMLIGIISGTYSTWFIAAPMTIWLEERAKKNGRPRSRGGPARRGAKSGAKCLRVRQPSSRRRAKPEARVDVAASPTSPVSPRATDRSVDGTSGKRWVEAGAGTPEGGAQAAALVADLGLHPLAARVLAARGHGARRTTRPRSS